MIQPGIQAEESWKEEIRAEDRRVHQLLKTLQGEPEEGRFYCTEVVVNSRGRPWPAVGTYSQHYRFYFDRDEGDRVRDPQPYPGRLRLVVLQSQVAARSWQREALYDLHGRALLVRDKGREFFFHSGIPVVSGPEGKVAGEFAGRAYKLFQDTLRFEEIDIRD